METTTQALQPALRNQCHRALADTAWLPLVIFSGMAAVPGRNLPPWLLMWTMALAIFAGFKWWTCARAVSNGVRTTTQRCAAYLFLWAGMDADQFLALDQKQNSPAATDWLFAILKIFFGATLTWGIARLVTNDWLAGWIGMIGLVFILHFGTFHLLALIWQSNGVNAQPLMHWPIASASLSDFWGNRWNSGFRDLAFGLFFVRLCRVVPIKFATLLIFLMSGLIHELVITFPVKSGYGFPTLYFMLQGIGLLMERSFDRRKPILARLFTIVIVLAPVGLLFPKPFIMQAIVPFLRTIKALP
jgi:hypothetical protein